MAVGACQSISYVIDMFATVIAVVLHHSSSVAGSAARRKRAAPCGGCLAAMTLDVGTGQSRSIKQGDSAALRRKNGPHTNNNRPIAAVHAMNRTADASTTVAHGAIIMQLGQRQMNGMGTGNIRSHRTIWRIAMARDTLAGNRNSRCHKLLVA